MEKENKNIIKDDVDNSTENIVIESNESAIAGFKLSDENVKSETNIKDEGNDNTNKSKSKEKVNNKDKKNNKNKKNKKNNKDNKDKENDSTKLDEINIKETDLDLNIETKNKIKSNIEKEDTDSKDENVNIDTNTDININIESIDAHSNNEEKNVDSDAEKENIDKDNIQIKSKDNKKDKKEKVAKKAPLDLDDVLIIEQTDNKDVKTKNKDFQEKQEHLKKVVEAKKAKKHEEYMEEIIKKRRKASITFMASFVFFIILVVFSTIFALINSGNENILKNVSVENVSLSELSKEEAVSKLSSLYNENFDKTITFQLEDYSRTISPSEIDFDINAEKTIENAYNVGRTTNILKDNFTILASYFKENKISIEYSYDRQLLEQVLNDISVKIPGKTLENTYSIKKNELIIIKGKDGVDVDKDSISDLIISSFINLKNDITIEIPTKATSPEPINLSEISDDITVEAKDARYNAKTKVITPEVNGVKFDISLNEAQKILAEDKDRYIIPLKITKPKIDIDAIKDKYNLYVYDDILAEETTYYDATYYTRSNNMDVATKQISGTVVKPGKEFSFNSFVGATSAEDGYLSAIGYAGGRAIPMMGGGVCQISSEIYSAALKVSGLKITERFNHVCPVSYLPPGQDATTDLGSCDLKFINNRKEPIKLILKTGNGVSSVEIRGVKEANEPVIKLISTTINTVPYQTNYIHDSSLKKGQQVLDTRGITGYTSKLYKETYVNGVLISKDLISTDTYQPLNEVYRTNK